MAVDVNSSGSSGNTWTAGAGPLSWTHAASANSGLVDPVGLVFTAYESIPNAAPTWDGVAMTQVNGTYSGVGGVFTLWAIVNPAYSIAGKTVSFGWATGVNYHAGISVLLTGAKQSTTIDANTSNTSGAATTFATAITTVADNCLALCFGYQNAAPTVTAGASTTMIIGNGGTIWAGKANSVTTPAGSTTLNFAAPSGSWIGVMASIAPPVVTTVSPRKALLGVGL